MLKALFDWSQLLVTNIILKAILYWDILYYTLVLRKVGGLGGGGVHYSPPSGPYTVQ